MSGFVSASAVSSCSRGSPLGEDACTCYVRNKSVGPYFKYQPIVLFPSQACAATFKSFYQLEGISLISFRIIDRPTSFRCSWFVWVVSFVCDEQCDTLSLQVMASWQTVTQPTSMLRRVQSAFSRPTLRLYLTFQPLKDREALLHIWNGGREGL